MAIIGDIVNNVAVPKHGVTLHNFPQALSTAAADAADILNNSSQSGKRLGAHIMLVDDLDAPTAASVYIAAGSAETDAWILATEILGTGAADITPA